MTPVSMLPPSQHAGLVERCAWKLCRDADDLLTRAMQEQADEQTISMLERFLYDCRREYIRIRWERTRREVAAMEQAA